MNHSISVVMYNSAERFVTGMRLFKIHQESPLLLPGDFAKLQTAFLQKSMRLEFSMGLSYFSGYFDG